MCTFLHFLSCDSTKKEENEQITPKKNSNQQKIPTNKKDTQTTITTPFYQQVDCIFALAHCPNDRISRKLLEWPIRIHDRFKPPCCGCCFFASITKSKNKTRKKQISCLFFVEFWIVRIYFFVLRWDERFCSRLLGFPTFFFILGSVFFFFFWQENNDSTKNQKKEKTIKKTKKKEIKIKVKQLLTKYWSIKCWHDSKFFAGSHEFSDSENPWIVVFWIVTKKKQIHNSKNLSIHQKKKIWKEKRTKCCLFFHFGLQWKRKHELNFTFHLTKYMAFFPFLLSSTIFSTSYSESEPNTSCFCVVFVLFLCCFCVVFVLFLCCFCVFVCFFLAVTQKIKKKKSKEKINKNWHRFVAVCCEFRFCNNFRDWWQKMDPTKILVQLPSIFGFWKPVSLLLLLFLLKLIFVIVVIVCCNCCCCCHYILVVVVFDGYCCCCHDLLLCHFFRVVVASQQVFVFLVLNFLLASFPKKRKGHNWRFFCFFFFGKFGLRVFLFLFWFLDLTWSGPPNFETKAIWTNWTQKQSQKRIVWCDQKTKQNQVQQTSSSLSIFLSIIESFVSWSLSAIFLLSLFFFPVLSVCGGLSFSCVSLAVSSACVVTEFKFLWLSFSSSFSFCCSFCCCGTRALSVIFLFLLCKLAGKSLICFNWQTK